MKNLIDKAPRFMFFTGKGGVGKTSMSCVISYKLVEKGKKVLLISTDPASNLDEVLETKLGNNPTPVNLVPNLWAMNIDPIQAAADYRERIVGPFRGVLPEEAVRSVEEQLSGACTVEIAAFNEFSQIIGQADKVKEYDHIILDTAPTGHTLRLLNLPSAWNDFVIENTTGSSCLGPLSGLKDQRITYENAVNALMDPEKTLLVLVARAEKITLEEAARAGVELRKTGMNNQHLIINGYFETNSTDSVAKSFALKNRIAIANMPDSLINLPRSIVKFKPYGLTGLSAITNVFEENAVSGEPPKGNSKVESLFKNDWKELLNDLEKNGKGLIMTMGKGGVGKTSMAAAIAVELANRGHKVHLSTTDPAAHLAHILTDTVLNLTVSRIDPKEETKKHVEQVIKEKEGTLSIEDMELLKEELRSPCTEEIAVFKAFAKAVAEGEDRFMVLDTAPTGHTLLLLDATESYHREVSRNSSGVDEEVVNLLPRLRNPEYTKILLVTLPEATPVHEAERLQDDLRRAKIEPFAWIINQSFAMSGTADKILAARGVNELKYINEVRSKNRGRVVISPWIADEINGTNQLKQLFKIN